MKEYLTCHAVNGRAVMPGYGRGHEVGLSVEMWLFPGARAGSGSACYDAWHDEVGLRASLSRGNKSVRRGRESLFAEPFSPRAQLQIIRELASPWTTPTLPCG